MTNYIGRDLDKISNIEILDNITFDGSQSYTLQKGGVNFTPNSAQSIILGIDGITQIGNFSVNGSTIDFGVAVANTSTCNYIIHLGTGLLTAPSDGSVTNAKLGTAPTLEAKGSGGTAGGVRYFCEQSSHHVTLRAGQHSGFSSGSFELKLPTAQGGANTFLKNDGSGNLSFAEAGGTFAQISRTDISGSPSTVAFNNVFSSTYRNYFIIGSGINFASNSVQLRSRLGVGTAYETAGYKATTVNDQYAYNGSIAGGSNGQSTGNFILNEFTVNANQNDLSFFAYVFIPNIANLNTSFLGRSVAMQQDSGYMIAGSFQGQLVNNAQITSINFFPSQGNFGNTGEITVYGIKES